MSRHFMKHVVVFRTVKNRIARHERRSYETFVTLPTCYLCVSSSPKATAFQKNRTPRCILLNAILAFSHSFVLVRIAIENFEDSKISVCVNSWPSANFQSCLTKRGRLDACKFQDRKIFPLAHQRTRRQLRRRSRLPGRTVISIETFPARGTRKSARPSRRASHLVVPVPERFGKKKREVEGKKH